MESSGFLVLEVFHLCIAKVAAMKPVNILPIHSQLQQEGAKTNVFEREFQNSLSDFGHRKQSWLYPVWFDAFLSSEAELSRVEIPVIQVKNFATAILDNDIPEIGTAWVSHAGT